MKLSSLLFILMFSFYFGAVNDELTLYISSLSSSEYKFNKKYCLFLQKWAF